MKRFFQTALILTSALISTTLVAQDNPQAKSEFSIPAQTLPFREFEQHGQLISLKLVPGKKELRLYIVGNDAASVSVDKFSVKAQVMMGRHRQEVKFKRGKDYFATKEEIKGEQLQLKVQDKESQKVEEFKVDLKKP